MENLTREERERLHEQEKLNLIDEEKSKKLRKKVIFYLIISIIIIGIAYFGISSSLKPGQYDDFAKCLTEKGTLFYGSFQCSHCIEQKKLFGNSIKYIAYVECGPLGGPQNQICQDAKIAGYPTWKIGNNFIEGVQSLEDLAQESGCNLNS
ncbi:MAG: hypothetical protein AABX61_00555 [Nanoarchaeota archaeon]